MDPLISSLLLSVFRAGLGAVLEAVIGLIGHALTGGRRDFSSVGGMRATVTRCWPPPPSPIRRSR